MSCPLTVATFEKPLKIVKILGNEESKTKLLDRGFCVGECLCVTRGKCGGDFILQTKNSKYAMGFGLASKIIVEEL